MHELGDRTAYYGDGIAMRPPLRQTAIEVARRRLTRVFAMMSPDFRAGVGAGRSAAAASTAHRVSKPVRVQSFVVRGNRDGDSTNTYWVRDDCVPCRSVLLTGGPEISKIASDETFEI